MAKRNRKQIKLDNNCRYSEPSVHPKNWKTGPDSLLKKSWYIKYTFYDDNLNKKKAVMIRCNRYSDIDGRRGFVEGELAHIKTALEDSKYNPITDDVINEYVDASVSEIKPSTPLIAALKFAQSKIQKAPSTMADIGMVIKNVEKALVALRFENIPIGIVGKKHMRQICDECSKLKKGGVSNDKFNRHRTYLGILYKEIIEFEAVENNVPLSLNVKDEIETEMRDTLTKEQRAKIDAYFKEKHLGFWRFLHIFFASGARGTEIMRVKVKDVDIDNGRVYYMVMKGKEYRIKPRVIKDNVLQLWKDAIAGAEPEMYVFSRNRYPGYEPVDSRANTQMWYDHCKKILGVTADFYSLKHINTTETRKLKGIAAAALQNAESEAMITKHYDIDAEKDEFEVLRKLNNSFA